MVREQTSGGREIVERVLAIARGGSSDGWSERSRTWALEWLGDRAFGRAVQPVDIANEPSVEMSPLDQVRGVLDVLSPRAIEALKIVHEEIEAARRAGNLPKLAAGEEEAGQ